MNKASNGNAKLFLTLSVCAFFASIILCDNSADQQNNIGDNNSGGKQTAQSPFGDSKSHPLSEFLAALPASVVSIKQADVNNDNLNDVLLTLTDNQILILMQQLNPMTPEPFNPVSSSSKNSIYYFPVTLSSFQPISSAVLSKTDVDAEETAPEFPEPVIIATEVIDVNKDGYNDIITAFAGTLNSPLQIQLGFQTGEFMDASSYLLPNLDATVLTKLKIADVNNDASPDIILTSIGRLNYEGDKILAEFSPRNYVLLNSGNGTFLDGTTELFGEVFAFTRAIDIQVRDFGVDGFNDILLINPDGNLLYMWSAETSTMQSADASNFSNVAPSSVNNQSIQLDANGDGIADTVVLQDGLPVIIYDSATHQKPSDSLTSGHLNAFNLQPQNSSITEHLNSVTSYVSPFQYKITGLSGLTIATVKQIGDVVYLELTSREPAYVWGNMLLTFDPAKLQCVSIEENPNNLYGFWVWWAQETGMPEYGGGGTYFYYAHNEVVSGWSKTWAQIDPGSGPAGTYDNTSGKIRIYAGGSNSGYSYTSPLRLGFRVLQAGSTDFIVQSNGFTTWDWNNVDAGTISTVNITESGQYVYKEDLTNNVRISISGPVTAEIGHPYTIDVWGEIVMPFRPIGTNVFSWELYIDGALYQRRGFTYGEEHRRSWEFTGTTEGVVVHKFRFRDGSRIHNGYGWVDVEIPIRIGVPFPHIDSITPTEGTPGTKITIKGANFNSILNENSISFDNGIIQPNSVDSIGTVITCIIPYTTTYGEHLIGIIANGYESNKTVFTCTTPEETLIAIINEKRELLNSATLTPEQYALIQEALKMLDGAEEEAQNGAIDMILGNEELQAIVVKIEKAIEYLKSIQETGFDMQNNINALYLLMTDMVVRSEEFSFKSYYAIETNTGKEEWREFSDIPLTITIGNIVKFKTESSPVWFHMNYEWTTGFGTSVIDSKESESKSEVTVKFSEEEDIEIVCQGTKDKDVPPADENKQPINVVKECELKIIEVLGLRKNEVGNYDLETNPHTPGRIFLDTVDDGEILAKPDQQRVKITVEVNFNVNYDLKDYRVYWQAFDPDDSADHKDVDPNDGGSPTGGTPKGGDNFGTAHEGVKFWFEKADHEISNQKNTNANDEKTAIGEAKTELSLKDNKIFSTVYFHYSDDGGDNFKLKAELVKTADKENASGYCLDETGILTAWRKRFVKIHAMTKQNDDIQIEAMNTTPGPYKFCILPGPNDGIDTMVIGGDDELTPGDKITTGANGKVETEANSGGNSFYPSSDTSLKGIEKALNQAYSNTTDFNHAAYIDIEISEGVLNLPYKGILTGMQQWSDYLDKNLHTNNKVHLSNTYDIVGVARIEGALGVADATPHCGISLRLVRELENKRDADTEVIHEEGHLLLKYGTNIHDGHTVNNTQPDCPFETSQAGGVTSLTVCEKHIKLLRENITRAWGNHIVTDKGVGESALDSDKK